MVAQDWGSDVPVSMPEPLAGRQGLIPMFGFTFTIDGLFPDISEVDHEALSRPTFAPVRPAETIYDDADLDGPRG